MATPNGAGRTCEELRVQLVTLQTRFHAGIPHRNVQRLLEIAAMALFGHAFAETTCEEVEQMLAAAYHLHAFFRNLGLLSVLLTGSAIGLYAMALSHVYLVPILLHALGDIVT